MNKTSQQDERIANMRFASVYPLYCAKVLKKGRTEAELLEVIGWLTGFNKQQVQDQINRNNTFAAFFEQARLNPDARLITGVVCGCRVETIDNPLTQKVRYLDKLVDELAKGRQMNKILRTS